MFQVGRAVEERRDQESVFASLQFGVEVRAHGGLCFAVVVGGDHHWLESTTRGLVGAATVKSVWHKAARSRDTIVVSKKKR